MPKLIGSWCGRLCEASTAGSMGPDRKDRGRLGCWGWLPRQLWEPSCGALGAAASGASGVGCSGAPGTPAQLHPCAPGVATPVPASAGPRHRDSHPGGARPAGAPRAPLLGLKRDGRWAAGASAGVWGGEGWQAGAGAMTDRSASVGSEGWE